LEGVEEVPYGVVQFKLESHVLQKLTKILQATPALDGIAVVTTDGLPVASILPSIAEENLISASFADAVSLAVNLTQQPRRGKLEEVYIKAAFGFVVVTPLSDERLLIYLCKPDTKLGLLFSGGGLPGTPLAPTPEPILPPKPPKRLVARAEPEYDDPE
jgi:uncharacterized protein